MEDAFREPQTDDERQIKTFIDRYNAQQATQVEQELFKQRTRLAGAERTLQIKTTKAATESKRIATDKIDAALRRLADFGRTEQKPARFTHFSRLLRARACSRRRAVCCQADALPVSYRREARELRFQIPRNIQRAAR